jgi:hypothetical protein
VGSVGSVGDHRQRDVVGVRDKGETELGKGWE